AAGLAGGGAHLRPLAHHHRAAAAGGAGARRVPVPAAGAAADADADPAAGHPDPEPARGGGGGADRGPEALRHPRGPAGAAAVRAGAGVRRRQRGRQRAGARCQRRAAADGRRPGRQRGAGAAGCGCGDPHRPGLSRHTHCARSRQNGRAGRSITPRYPGLPASALAGGWTFCPCLRVGPRRSSLEKCLTRACPAGHRPAGANRERCSPSMNPVIRWFHLLGSPPYFDRFAARWAPWFWLAALLTLSVGTWLALFGVPADYQQGDSARILYIHVPAAWMSMFVFALMAFYAVIALVWRIKLCEILAMACAPIGAG